jgi:carboxylesterase
MTTLMPGGEPFFYLGGRTGCLLTHGFTGTPYEMHWLGRNLADHGYTALGVRLFAHATQQNDLKRARRGDWKASVLDGYYMLQSQCDDIFLIGLSMGAVLSLSLAPQLDVKGVVVMSTPIETPNKLAQRLRPILPWLSLVMPTMGKGEADWADPSVSETHVEYPDFIVAAVPQLADQIKEMRSRLPQVHCPVLLMASHGDQSVGIDHSQRILEELGSTDKQLIPFERSGHNMPLDAERDRILEETISFIQRIEGQSQ